jgi:3-hydroxyacyl-[acyl-carrier-protein] dehydratase
MAAVNEITQAMSEASSPDPVSQHLIFGGQRPLTSADEKFVMDALKRCSPLTREAAREFRRTGNPERLPAIIDGLIEHYVEPDARAKLGRGDDSLRLVEDLAIDSLTMLEIVSLAEDVLQITIDNGEIRPVRTVGDIKTFIASKLGRAAPHGARTGP